MNFAELTNAAVDFATDPITRARAQTHCADMCPQSVQIDGTHIGGGRGPSGRGAGIGA